MPDFSSVYSDTRLQHHLMDIDDLGDPFTERFMKSLSNICYAVFNVGITIVFIALWATIIYITAKGIYRAVAYISFRVKAYMKTKSLRDLIIPLPKTEKDLESQNSCDFSSTTLPKSQDKYVGPTPVKSEPSSNTHRFGSVDIPSRNHKMLGKIIAFPAPNSAGSSDSYKL